HESTGKQTSSIRSTGNSAWIKVQTVRLVVEPERCGLTSLGVNCSALVYPLCRAKRSEFGRDSMYHAQRGNSGQQSPSSLFRVMWPLSCSATSIFVFNQL